MADQDSNSGRRVLHVASPSHEPSNDIANALTRTGCEVDVCPDVYRTLARICRPGADLPAAVVVCVDWLEAGQFEFFQLATERRQTARIYVYAEPRNYAKIELALQLGADSEVNPENVDQVLPTQSGGKPVTAPANPAASTAAPPPPAAEPETKPAPAEQKPIGTGTVRVPWLRYEGGPTRVPPAKQNAGPPEPDRAPELETDPRLLSPEELDALIGEPERDAEADAPAAKKRRRDQRK